MKLIILEARDVCCPVLSYRHERHESRRSGLEGGTIDGKLCRVCFLVHDGRDEDFLAEEELWIGTIVCKRVLWVLEPEMTENKRAIDAG